MTWTDKRLNITIPEDFPTNYIRFGPDVLKYIWIPDVYIDGLKDLRMPAYKVRIIRYFLNLNSSETDHVRNYTFINSVNETMLAGSSLSSSLQHKQT